MRHRHEARAEQDALLDGHPLLRRGEDRVATGRLFRLPELVLEHHPEIHREAADLAPLVVVEAQRRGEPHGGEGGAAPEPVGQAARGGWILVERRRGDELRLLDDGERVPQNRPTPLLLVHDARQQVVLVERSPQPIVGVRHQRHVQDRESEDQQRLPQRRRQLAPLLERGRHSGAARDLSDRGAAEGVDQGGGREDQQEEPGLEREARRQAIVEVDAGDVDARLHDQPVEEVVQRHARQDGDEQRADPVQEPGEQAARTVEAQRGAQQEGLGRGGGGG